MKFFILAACFISSLASAESRQSCYIKPCEIRGDFDGDKKMDTAILIVDNSKNRGIKVQFANKKTVTIGAGDPFGNGGTNFDWMDRWSLHKGEIGQGATESAGPPLPKGDSLLLEKTNSASGIVYWNGSEFMWYQQGD